MTDIMPTSDTCDRQIQLYNGNTELFMTRAQKDFEHFHALEDKAIKEGLFEQIFASFNAKDIDQKHEVFSRLDGSLFCYCYAVKSSPVM